MRIRKSTLWLVALALLLSVYAVNLSFRLDRELAPAALDLLIIFAILAAAYLKYRNVLNPITLLAPLLFAHFFYTYRLSARQEDLSLSVEASYYLFILFYIAGCLVPLRVRDDPTFSPAGTVRSLANSILVVAILISLIEAYLNGGFPLVLLLRGSATIYGDLRFVPVAHYVVMLTALIPAMYYYASRTDPARRRHFLMGSLLVAGVLLNTLSRQVMIFALLSFAIVYARLNRIDQTTFFLRAGGIVALFFLVFGALRTSTLSDLQLVDYLKAASGVPLELDVNTTEVTYNLYTSMNLGTLNQIHESNKELFWGAYTFRPLVELLRLDANLGVAVPEDLDTFKILGTILADPYLDFGLAGVAIFGFAYGALGMVTYKLSSRRSNLGHTLMWATFAFAMVMGVFANFFNVLFTWLCFGFCAALSGQFSIFPKRVGAPAARG